jgi:hypothetical membrane protein
MEIRIVLFSPKHVTGNNNLEIHRQFRFFIHFRSIKMKTLPDAKSRLFLFCGMIAPAILGVTVLVVGYITPGYNPVSDSVSLMGTPEQPYAWLLSSGYWFYGILMLFAVFGLHCIFINFPQIKPLSTLLGIHALGTILLAVFPDSTTSFYREMIHNFVSGIAYAPLLVMIYIFRNLTRENSSFNRLRAFGLFVLFINIPLPFVHMVGPLSVIGGLLQRVLCACSFTWLRFAFFTLYKAQFSFTANNSDKGQLTLVEARDHMSTGMPDVRVGHILQKNHRF